MGWLDVAKGLLARLRELVEGNPAVRRVADDPAMTAELLLLFRMALADGEVTEREMTVLKRIAAEAFDIGDDDFDQVTAYLAEFGYEISAAQAILVFQEMDRDRRVALARHLAEIAKADTELNRYEVRLLARVVDMLGLQSQDVLPEVR